MNKCVSYGQIQYSRYAGGSAKFGAGKTKKKFKKNNAKRRQIPPVREGIVCTALPPPPPVASCVK